MGSKLFEHILGVHAAPTLVGLKPASLISFQKSRFEDFDALLASYNTCFTCKGLSIFRVAEGEEYTLILFFRAGELERRLKDSQADQILTSCGYKIGDSLSAKLDYLALRMRMQKSFPHEIGLFLGYPPEDVRGFIENHGRGFSFSGYWKVYANEDETRELFEQYSSCTNDFCSKLAAGSPLPELLAAV